MKLFLALVVAAACFGCTPDNKGSNKGRDVPVAPESPPEKSK